MTNCESAYNREFHDREREAFGRELTRSEDLERKYFRVTHPLSERERREFAREVGILNEVYFTGK
jgi:hypothetical protein